MPLDKKKNIPEWKDKDGKLLVCTEKLKILRDNEDELRQFIKDLFEDADILGADLSVIEERLILMIRSHNNL